MAITKKQCAWPECENEFYGTKRKEYCGNTCKNKQWRLNKKESNNEKSKEA
tara:strand:+ start:1837 stop:1989 length:153 start_codon:yes stop_codon:yes gene_type:complete